MQAKGYKLWKKIEKVDILLYHESSGVSIELKIATSTEVARSFTFPS
jgi:hypothetical protein